MKKSSVAVAALLTTLSATTIIPVAYAVADASSTQQTAPATGCSGCAPSSSGCTPCSPSAGSSSCKPASSSCNPCVPANGGSTGSGS